MAWGPDGRSKVNRILNGKVCADPASKLSIHFGDLTTKAEDSSGGTSNKTRGLFAKGGIPSKSGAIDYITIASTGNGTDFGDRTVEGTYSKACSNGNGGLA